MFLAFSLVFLDCFSFTRLMNNSLQNSTKGLLHYVRPTNYTIACLILHSLHAVTCCCSLYNSIINQGAQCKSHQDCSLHNVIFLQFLFRLQGVWKTFLFEIFTDINISTADFDFNPWKSVLINCTKIEMKIEKN